VRLGTIDLPDRIRDAKVCLSEKPGWTSFVRNGRSYKIYHSFDNKSFLSDLWALR